MNCQHTEFNNLKNEDFAQMNCSIRNATLHDREGLALLSGQLGYSSNPNEILLRLEALLKSPDHCVFVAVEEEKVRGWIHGFYALRVESDPFVEIGGLVVDENSRKKGLGKMLIEHVNLWAESKGCKDVRVRCNILRKESHDFYERLGFVENKVQKIFGKKLSE